MAIRIIFLADEPAYLPTVAGWIYDEWLCHEAGNSLATTEAMFRGHLQRAAVPLTLVAVAADGQAIGTASLYLHDMSTRPTLSPWLAAVYVVPARRGQGIGTLLVQEIEQVARGLGIPRLYLFTPDRANFYARMGWTKLETSEYRNESVVIMTKALNAP